MIGSLRGKEVNKIQTTIKTKNLNIIPLIHVLLWASIVLQKESPTFKWDFYRLFYIISAIKLCGPVAIALVHLKGAHPLLWSTCFTHQTLTN